MIKLISFLGTGKYSPCIYGYGKENATETQFVQTAIAELFLKENPKNTKVYLFLTEKAKKENWENKTEIDPNDLSKTITKIGLKETWEKLLPEIEIQPIMINDHQGETDQQKLFNQIFDVLEEGDVIYFDITHGFRSLPVIALITLNYARFLKNCQFGKMLYGCFEDRDPISNVVPIIDLSNMISILDWTNGVERFINTGDASLIQKITETTTRPLLKKTRGKHKEAQQLENLAKNLNNFTQTFQTCRGKQIHVKGQRLKKELLDTKKINIEEIKPLAKLLNKIEEKIDAFNGSQIHDGFIAVRWCLDHGLIQQSYTMLQETFITAICWKNDLQFDVREQRMIVTKILNEMSRTWSKSDTVKTNDNEKTKNEDLIEKEIKVKNYLEYLLKKFPDLPVWYGNLTQYRNNINHSEMNNDTFSHNDLVKMINKLITNLEPVFHTILSEENS